MKRIFTVTLAALVLVGGILLVVLSPAHAGLQPASPAPAQPQVQEQPAAAGFLEGIYAGSVQLGAVVKGVYSDEGLSTPTPQPAGTPSPDLGAIDLALFLRQNGKDVSGYVDLDTTLVFTRTGTVIQATPVGYPTGQPTPAPLTPIAIGPQVDGTFDGTTLTLTSAEQNLQTKTGLTLTRRFHIVATLLSGSRQAFEGEYRETFRGFHDDKSAIADTPLTVVGKVTLYSTIVQAPLAAPHTYLPLIMKK